MTSPFDPASPQAESIANLFWITLAILSVILVIVCGLTAYIVVRFRGKEGDPEPKQVHGNTKLEITWTVIPLIIVIALLLLSVKDMANGSPASNIAGQQPDIVVVGHQWWWEVRYPQANVTTANEVRIPTGRPMLVRLESFDVIHDFWVPQLGPKQDAVPGHPNHLFLQANAPGAYDGACAEFCGDAHAWMRIRVIAQPQQDFDAWLAAEAKPMAATTGKGAQYFKDLACINCHAINGLTPDMPDVAPDLTYLSRRQTIGAGVASNSREELARWLRNPQAVKPQCLMPDFNLSEEQIEALVDMLWSTREP